MLVSVMKKSKIVIKIILSVVLVMALFFCGNLVYTPKWLKPNNPQTFQINEFASVPENSIDVLFLGSCQSYQGINPCVIWEQNRITSYVLASPDQKMYSTYYFLKYALETQSPKYLLLDSLFLIRSNSLANNYDTKALYSMSESKTKMEFSEYLFDLGYEGEKNTVQYNIDRIKNKVKTKIPFFKFNNRFDFRLSDITYYFSYENNVSFLGGVPMFETMDLSSHKDFLYEKKECETIDERADLFFRKIVNMCNDNDIKIIMFKTLSPYYWNLRCHESVVGYLSEFDIPFIDFNIDYSQYGFDLSEHMYERFKLNNKGMTITSEFLGDYLTSKPELQQKSYSRDTIDLYDSVLNKYKKVASNAKWKNVELIDW